MKAKIDFTQYPKIFKYVAHLVDKPYFKPFGHSIINEETFVEIVENWIDQYEKNIETYVKNTMLLYELCNGQSGHEALSQDWERWKGHVKNRFTEEQVRKYWHDNFVSCIAHLYQNMAYEKNHTIHGGSTSCGITCSFDVRFVDSDQKYVKCIAVSSFRMSFTFEHSRHDEVDIRE